MKKYDKNPDFNSITDREIQELQLQALESIRKNTAILADVTVYSLIIGIVAAVIVIGSM